MTEYQALTLEEAQKLINNYQERINSAFDAMSKVQEAAMDITDKIVYGKRFPFETSRYGGFNNVLYFRFKTYCQVERRMPATVIKEMIKNYVDEKEKENDE